MPTLDINYSLNANLFAKYVNKITYILEIFIKDSKFKTIIIYMLADYEYYKRG